MRNMFKQNADQCNARLARLEEGLSRLFSETSPERAGSRRGSQSVSPTPASPKGTIRRSASSSSLQWTNEYDKSRRPSVHSRRPSNSDVSGRTDGPSGKPLAAELGSPAHVGLTQIPADLVKSLERLNKTCDAKVARLEELLAELGQDWLSRITASSSSPTVASSTAACPGYVAAGDVNSSHARPNLSHSPLPNSLASPVSTCTGPEDARQRCHTVPDPWDTVSLLEGSMHGEGSVEHR